MKTKKTKKLIISIILIFIIMIIVENVQVMSYSTKRIDGTSIIDKEETIIENRSFSKIVIIFAFVLLMYWILLLFIFERDKKYPISNLNEEKLFEKYNPLLAGCIQGNREILSRDILAVILNLIDKKIITLETYNNTELKSDTYKYMVSRNPDKEKEMDQIELYVYNWLFLKEKRREIYQDETNLVDSVDLVIRLKDMTKGSVAGIKFRTLNKIAQKELEEYGANQPSISEPIRAFNTMLLAISIVVVLRSVQLYEGISIKGSVPFIIIFTIALTLTIVPITLLAIKIITRIVAWIRRKIHKYIVKYTGQKVVITAITLWLILGIILVISKVTHVPNYILADEFLLGISIIIVLTDNLMLKNSVMMIEDFSRLNALKDKIEEYTIIDDKDIEQLTLWEKYLSYAISFGIANKLMHRIKNLYIDENIMKIDEIDILCEYARTILLDMFSRRRRY